MRLSITRYLDASPTAVRARLDDAVARTHAPTGARIHVEGIDRLAALTVTVPWPDGDPGATALTTNRFAGELADELAAAA